MVRFQDFDRAASVSSGERKFANDRGTADRRAYYAASRKLVFLREHALICGLFYGAVVDQVMSLIVLPLSALHARGPFELKQVIVGLGVHMVLIGLPISFSVRKLAR